MFIDMVATTVFFRPGEARCLMYSRARDLDDKHHTKGREFIEQLWQECGRFLDANAASRAMADLPSVFWELYLAHALRRCGIEIVEQGRTKKRQKGPDLFATHPEVWIEAVVANPGAGADALEPLPLGVACSVPVDPFILRLRSVIEAKSKVIEGYVKDKIIEREQATIIAISGCVLDTRFSEYPVPRAVRAALGVGNLVVEINRATGVRAGYSVEHHEQIHKANGALVKTDVFLDPAYGHVSAVIYSAADWVNTPAVPGTEFIVIHNQNATTKLPHGWLPFGDEYWREENDLRHVRHSDVE